MASTNGVRTTFAAISSMLHPPRPRGSRARASPRGVPRPSGAFSLEPDNHIALFIIQAQRSLLQIERQPGMPALLLGVLVLAADEAVITCHAVEIPPFEFPAPQRTSPALDIDTTVEPCFEIRIDEDLAWLS